MKNGNSEIFYNQLWRSHFPSLFCFANGRIFVKMVKLSLFSHFWRKFGDDFETTKMIQKYTEIEALEYRNFLFSGNGGLAYSQDFKCRSEITI